MAAKAISASVKVGRLRRTRPLFVLIWRSPAEWKSRQLLGGPWDSRTLCRVGQSMAIESLGQIVARTGSLGERVLLLAQSYRAEVTQWTKPKYQVDRRDTNGSAVCRSVPPDLKPFPVNVHRCGRISIQEMGAMVREAVVLGLAATAVHVRLSQTARRPASRGTLIHPGRSEAEWNCSGSRTARPHLVIGSCAKIS